MKLANRAGIPVVPRAGGTGLNDGAVPLRGGIVVDVKRMNEIKEVDLADRCVTVGPGISMMKLNEELSKYCVFHPDTPASYPCSLVGGRIACSGFSLLAASRCSTRRIRIKRTEAMREFVYKQQYTRPEAQRISDGVTMRLHDVYEVDPALMEKAFQTAEDAAVGHRADCGMP